MHIHPIGISSTHNGVSNSSNLEEASHVYVVEKGNAIAVVTITDSAGTIKASFGLAGQSSLTFSKLKTDKIYASTADCHFTPLGYAN